MRKEDSRRSGPPGRGAIRAALVLTGSVALLVALLASLVDGSVADRATRAFGFFWLSVPALLLALADWRRFAGRLASLPSARWLFACTLLLVMLPDRFVAGALVDLIGAAIYAAAALLLTVDRPRKPTALWRDLLLVPALWWPLELDWMNGRPELLMLLGIDLLLWLYVVERPVIELGRIVPTRRNEWAWGAGCWLMFLPVAIPIAMATDFAQPGLADDPPLEWAGSILMVLWLTAFPEEALFRGVIQGLFRRALRHTGWALLIAAVIFGLAHADNQTNIDPPDWRYVVLATIAGGFYGLAYIKTDNLGAPILAHTLVDVTWGGLFAG